MSRNCVILKWEEEECIGEQNQVVGMRSPDGPGWDSPRVGPFALGFESFDEASPLLSLRGLKWDKKFYWSHYKILNKFSGGRIVSWYGVIMVTVMSRKHEYS